MRPIRSRLPRSGLRTGRRRHARPRKANWAKRAGFTTGVVGAALLVTSVAPARPVQGRLSAAPFGQLVLDVANGRAADATAQQAVSWQLWAAEERDAAAARAEVRKRSGAAGSSKSMASAASETAKKARPAAGPSPVAPRAAVAVRPSAIPAPVVSSGGIAVVLAFVKAQVGKPYVLGGTGPAAFDCSGLVQAAYLTIGVALPRVSEDQSTAGTQVSLSNLKPGDILYWGRAGNAYHVAIYVGGGEFIGAQNPTDGVAEHPLDYDEPTGAVRVI